MNFKFQSKCLFFGICLVSSIFPLDVHSTPTSHAAERHTDLLLDNIYAVHATRTLPDADLLRAGLNIEECNDLQKKIFSHVRQTLHFSLGELVRPVDGFMNWEDCPYALVTPIRKLLPQLLNINCYDTFILGDLALESDTYLFLPIEIADQIESRATLIPYDSHSKSLREAIDEFILFNDAWPILMNEDDIEDELHEAYMDGINVNTLDFFEEVKEEHPWISIGLRFEPLDGEHYRLSQIEQILISIKTKLLSLSRQENQLDTSYLQQSALDINEHFEKWSQSLNGFNWCEQSQKAYQDLAIEVNNLTDLIQREISTKAQDRLTF